MAVEQRVEPSGSKRLALVVTTARRLPFTISVVIVMLLIALGTGSLWNPVAERTWFPEVAYGLPSLT